MGRVGVTVGDETVERELARASLVGRHPMCSLVLSDERVPAFWFEVRFRNGLWMWRGFRPEVVGTSWAAWTVGMDGQITFGDTSISVVLLDDTPPRSFAVDIVTGKECVAQQFETLLYDLREDQRLRLRNYGVEVVGEKPYRFFEVEA